MNIYQKIGLIGATIGSFFLFDADANYAQTAANMPGKTYEAKVQKEAE